MLHIFINNKSNNSVNDIVKMFHFKQNINFLLYVPSQLSQNIFQYRLTLFSCIEYAFGQIKII